MDIKSKIKKEAAGSILIGDEGLEKKVDIFSHCVIIVSLIMTLFLLVIGGLAIWAALS
ncbi:MAG: hypothetical protein K6G62_03770 [Eubacterium sp.]|nr:hypothetical protein [Eubacterium sp.]